MEEDSDGMEGSQGLGCIGCGPLLAVANVFPLAKTRTVGPKLVYLNLSISDLRLSEDRHLSADLHLST